MKVRQPSTIEALGGAHKALLEDLQALETAAASCPPGNAAEFRRSLDQVWKHITKHFRFEEKDGYMDSVLQRQPHRERTIDQLREEHRELARSLQSLREEVKAGKTLEKSFGEKVQAWVAHVRDHETRENLLVQEVFNLDIAAED
jgi:hemerythrin-like domain-containing protein